MDNQNKIWLPMNSITEKIWYTNDEKKNMRILLGSLTSHPSAWTITKVENAQPFGLQKLTIYSNFFNEHTDYVNLETGEMYANYYDSPIEPENSNISSTLSSITSKLSTVTSYIKVGGSYKAFTLNVYNEISEDITEKYSSSEFKWKCFIDDVDWTDKVIWKEDNYNKIKLKFPNDMSQLGKIITISCSIIKDNIEVTSTSAKFDIIK